MRNNQIIFRFHWNFFCLVRVEFMEMYRWENMMVNKFLNMNMKMLHVMWCYQTCMLLASRMSIRMLNGRKWKVVSKNSKVELVLKWIMRCMHLYWMTKTNRDYWSPCKTKEIVKVNAYCGICDKYKFCVAWCGGNVSFVSP